MIDNGGLLLEMFLISMIASLTNVERVLVTRDQHRLLLFTEALPNNVICLRHEGTIEKLIESGF